MARVYLPAGTWYSLHNDSLHPGGKALYQAAPLEELPVFVRGGSIVPMQKQVQHTGESAGDTLDIHLWPGADGSFTYYEDDGTTYAHEQGQFHRRDLRYTGGRRLTLGAAQGQKASLFKFVRVVVHGQRPPGSTPRQGKTSLAWTDAPWQPFRPISRFDPLGVNASGPKVPRLPALVLPYSNQATDISW